MKTGRTPAPDMHASRFQVALGRLVHRAPRMFHRLGRIESSWLRDSLSARDIDRPIYVTGLARSGTTILLELLAQLPGLVSHRYKDFPLVHVPYWWNAFLDRAGPHNVQPRERAHKDGIYITPDSPEAMEEVLWMSFFPACHEPGQTNVMSKDMQAPAFEAFYRDHIRKLLFLRKGQRYLCKGNYNLTRLQYLHALFPEARFLIPVREPVSHVASLMKQHDRFCREERADPRVLRYMQLAGHYEFGLDRRPIHCQDASALTRIQRLWQDGEEVRGWAAYWAMIHNHIRAVLRAEAQLARRCLLVPYETFCASPRPVLERILRHCELQASPEMLDQLTARVHSRASLPAFSDSDMDVIHSETEAAFSRMHEMML
jgi:hypothetical protein